MLKACRRSQGACLLANQRIVPRFGTEGSEVQILSPRPIPKEICEIQSAGSLGFSSGFESRNRVAGASNPTRIPNRSRVLHVGARDRSFPRTFRSRVLPSTLPDLVVAH